MSQLLEATRLLATSTLNPNSQRKSAQQLFSAPVSRATLHNVPSSESSMPSFVGSQLLRPEKAFAWQKTCASMLRSRQNVLPGVRSFVQQAERDGILEASKCEDVELTRDPVDVIILSNGPGEVVTWVKPIVCALREHFQGNSDLRISVVLSPCPHASGRELELVQSFKEVDRCQGPQNFWQLLLLGRTAEGWDWHKKGVCIFLGGDQFYALIVGRRLGYKVAVYAEDVVRWPGLVDMYVVPSSDLKEKVPKWYQSNCQVIGDLFWDAVALADRKATALSKDETVFFHSRGCKGDGKPLPIVGILPGSKAVKLSIGVPYLMSIAEHIFERSIVQWMDISRSKHF